jgi:hypothetical protein
LEGGAGGGESIAEVIAGHFAEMGDHQGASLDKMLPLQLTSGIVFD